LELAKQARQAEHTASLVKTKGQIKLAHYQLIREIQIDKKERYQATKD
jgi:hypothetical protein